MNCFRQFSIINSRSSLNKQFKENEHVFEQLNTRINVNVGIVGYTVGIKAKLQSKRGINCSTSQGMEDHFRNHFARVVYGRFEEE